MGKQKKIGKYEVRGRLGKGGMGKVYRALDPDLDREVAIKTLRARSRDDKFVLRLETEGRILAKISHPNIAVVHGIETEKNRPFLVMELVDGPSLQDRVDAQDLRQDEVLTIGGGVASGLAAAHQLGISHRDLKPSNVLLAPDGTPKILDFGLAVHEFEAASQDETLPVAITPPGTIVGTTPYMSPQQLRGQPAGPSDDVWAFGCTVFELLSGSHPFRRGTDAETTLAIQREDPDWALLPESQIRGVVEKCLSKDPKDRFADGSELALCFTVSDHGTHVRRARRMEVVLVASTPGTGKTAALERLVAWGREADWIEESWRLVTKFEDLLSEESGQSVPNLLILPKPVLRQHWIGAVDRLKDELSEAAAEGADKAIVSIHFVWFHSALRQYIQLMDTGDFERTIAPFRVSHVMCLIDDVYDTYARLRRPGQLFDSHVRRLTEEEAARGGAFRRHLRLLGWRALEVGAAEAIAYSLGAPFTLLAVKHQPSVAAHALTGGTQIYMSHPITEIRRLEASELESNQERARLFKRSLWSIQNRLANDLAVLQPTCIDELRLQKDDDAVRLSARFYQHEDYSDRLSTDATALGDDVIYDDRRVQTETEDPAAPSIARELAETFESHVINEVTARDLQMVTQAEHLVVYRPRFNGNLSNGVLREIEYFYELQQGADGPAGKVWLMDVEEDARAYNSRQFVRKMREASRTGEWDVVFHHSSEDALEHLGTETRALLEGLSPKAEYAQILKAIEAVRTDLGHRDPTDWALAEPDKISPLSSAGTYPADVEKVELFCRKLASALQPLVELPPYSRCEMLDVSRKSDEEVAKTITEAISGEVEAENLA